LFSSKAEIIEQRYTVSLGPDTDGTGVSERVVASFDRYLAVESDFELVAREIHPQRVPLIGGNSHVYVFERPPTSLDGVIDRHVILQCVGAGDVVVFAVLPTPDDAASLVLVARDWLELHLDVSVFQRNIFFYAPRKRPLAGLLEHVRLTRRRSVGFHCPSRGPAAGITGQPASRQFTRFGIIKVHGLGEDGHRAICILLIHWFIRLFGFFRCTGRVSDLLTLKSRQPSYRKFPVWPRE